MRTTLSLLALCLLPLVAGDVNGGAVNDTYVVQRDGLLHLGANEGVLANDEGLPVNPGPAIISPPGAGRASILPDGGIAYAPALGFHGTDLLRYRLSDGSEATVTFQVGSPSVLPDKYTVGLDTPLVVQAPGPWANDSATDANPLRFIIDSISDGLAIGHHSGWFAWIPPDEGWTGMATIVYRATDSKGLWSQGEITILVATPTARRTYTIRNEGTADLLLPEGARLDGDSAFRVTLQPAPVVAPGNETHMEVEFAPTIAGVHRATLIIPNNDPDENPFDFVLQGTAQ